MASMLIMQEILNCTCRLLWFYHIIFFLTELHHILREELWGLCVCKGGTQVWMDAKVERVIKQPHSIECWSGQ